jgi:sialate O-acetylesterase
MFSDGMVLQRGKEVPVWGWAKAGTAAHVVFNGQELSTEADSNGKWMLKLSPMASSKKDLTMEITVGSENKSIKNILIGEVWLCTGQSNMAWTMSASAKASKNPKWNVIPKFVQKEIDTAKDPFLRHIKVPNAVSLHQPLKNFKGEWMDVQPSQTGNFTATGYWFAKSLREALDVPVGLLSCNYGGTKVQAWIPKSGFMENQGLKLIYNREMAKLEKNTAQWNPQKLKDWQAEFSKLKDPEEKRAMWRKRPTEPVKNKHLPSTLYNAMMHALVPYSIQGAIWYQGEGNAGYYADQYADHLSTMVSSWRKAWGQGDFSFYFAQLANFKEVNEEPLQDNGWATVCDQQRLAMAIPKSGMAVLNDIGEAEDIHPRNKVEVGQRLALWALAKDYGQKNTVYSGPLYRESHFKADKVTIVFDSVGDGLMVGDKKPLSKAEELHAPLKGFQICGKDGQWKWAKAKIVSKNSVEVYHPSFSEPTEVRYAWAPNPPSINLYNKSGLPTSIFKARK